MDSRKPDVCLIVAVGFMQVYAVVPDIKLLRIILG